MRPASRWRLFLILLWLQPVCGVALVYADDGMALSAQLLAAVRNGDLEASRHLLEAMAGSDQVADVDTRDVQGYTAMHWAARRGSLGIARLLIANGARVDVPAKRLGNALPIEYAARYNYPDLVALLIAHGANSEWRKNSILQVAASAGAGDVLRLAVDAGLPLQVNDIFGNSPLHLAVVHGYPRLVRELIRAGADVQALNRRGLTPLQLALKGGHEQSLQWLLDGGASLGSDDDLYLAARGGSPRLVGLALDAGGDPDWRSKDGRSALYAGVESGSVAVVEALIAAGATVAVLDKRGLSPLYEAAARGHTAMAQRLIEAGAPVAGAQAGRRGPVAAALQAGHTQTLALLLANCPQCEAAPIAARVRGQRELVAEFDRAGVDLSQTPADTAAAALTKAVSRGKGYAAALIDAGIPLGEGPSSPGAQALLLAATLGSQHSLRLLLDHGVDVGVGDKQGRTALHNAAHYGHAETVDFLVGQGADVNARMRGKTTPLHEAAGQGYAGVVDALLGNGADLAARNANRDTPLHTALRAYKPRRHDTGAAVAVLVGQGADVNAPGGRYCAASPLGLAIKAGSATVVELLLQHGAKAGVEDACLKKTPVDYVRGRRSRQRLLPLFEALTTLPAASTASTAPSPPSAAAPVGAERGRRVAQKKSNRRARLSEYFTVLSTGTDGKEWVLPIGGKEPSAVKLKLLRARYGSTGVPPYLRLDPGDNAATITAALQGRRRHRLPLSDAHLVLVGGDGGFIPYLPSTRVMRKAFQEMKQAPAEGYRPRLLVEPGTGQDQYFYFRVDGFYGKGRVTGPRFKFKKGRPRALSVGLQVYLGRDTELAR